MDCQAVHVSPGDIAFPPVNLEVQQLSGLVNTLRVNALPLLTFLISLRRRHHHAAATRGVILPRVRVTRRVRTVLMRATTLAAT